MLNEDVLGIIMSKLDQTDACELRRTSRQNNLVFNTWLNNKDLSLCKNITDDELLEIIESGMNIIGLINQIVN